MDSGDLNNLITNQCLVVDNRANGLSNVPSDFTSMGILTVTATSENYGAEQRLYVTQTPNSNAIYYRYKWGNNWSNWYRNDNYNTSSLNGLASALGATRESQELIVDLGLPSGRKWATHNIDVTMQNGFTKSIYQYECSFFSWGNTFGVNPISSSTFSYNWGTGNDGPYASTPGASLTGNAELGYDAAFANLGNSWRLPTTEDFAELFNSSNTKYVDASGTEIADATNKLTTINGIIGIRLMSKVNGKTIFFPCSGRGDGTYWNNRGKEGRYWSSSLFSSTNGQYLSFFNGGIYPQGNNSRFFGFAVRPIQ